MKIYKIVLTFLTCIFLFQSLSADALAYPPQDTKIARPNLLTNRAVDSMKKELDKKELLVKELKLKDKKNYMKYAVSFITGSLLILLIWLLKSRNEQQTINKSKHSKMIFDSNDRLEYENLQRQNIQQISRIRELEIILDKNNINLKKAEDRIFDLEEEVKALQATKSHEFKEPIEEDVVPDSTRYMYFPSPLSDGSFRKIDGKPQFLEGASIYRFSMISDLEADFEFCDDSSSVSMAINNRNDLILSVAEEMEGSSAGAKKILTYKRVMGKVLLEDNKWIVMRKAQIKYV